MIDTSLEKRVAELEQQVATLQAQKANEARKTSWTLTVGKYPELEEVFAEAMKLRAADRKKARQKPRKAKPASS